MHDKIILSGWTGTLFAKMACHTLPLIEEYAERHGALFACTNLQGDRPPSWNKVLFLLHALQHAKEVAWIDCDVVIERGHLSIFDEMEEGAWQGVVEHHTECGTVPNCGIWVVRQEMIPVLEEIWNSGENINHPWWEQASVITRMGYEVRHTNARLLEPTELHQKTTFLRQEWNHHPSDIRKVEKPFFRHITMYEDRVACTIKYKEIAEQIKLQERNGLEEPLEGPLESTSQRDETRVIVTDNDSAVPSPLPRIRKNPNDALRILVQSRRNLFQAKGGDTFALIRSCEALESRGVKIKVDIEGRENPSDYDLVHLYNFATPEELEPRARKAKELEVPFVVTTLHEDLDLFFPKMRLYGENMTKHLYGEYSAHPFEVIQEAINKVLPTCPNTLLRNNSFVATHAEALFSSGSQESELLEKDFPQAKRIEVVKFGCDSLPEVSKDLFYNKYGVTDYILCVGRIEWRKNQAMLLKALEDSELPVVLVAGNMTYQPEYQESVSRFQRKGKTLIVSNLSREELASAYKGALVHALPSWYELPGLVSLEAAKCGTPIVGTTMGTLSDYMGREATYCNPESLQSIRTAIEVTINKKIDREKLIEKASQYTWENTAKNLIEMYASVLDNYQPERSQAIFRSRNIDGNTVDERPWGRP